LNKKTENEKRRKKRSSFEECARVLCADKAYFSRRNGKKANSAEEILK
jgi:hypothetical protein